MHFLIRVYSLFFLIRIIFKYYWELVFLITLYFSKFYRQYKSILKENEFNIFSVLINSSIFYYKLNLKTQISEFNLKILHFIYLSLSIILHLNFSRADFEIWKKMCLDFLFKISISNSFIKFCVYKYFLR